MKLPFTSVVSLHTNEYGCGVARFSTMLARRLGVPFVGLSRSFSGLGAHPLLSLKWSECAGESFSTPPRYSVFWHDRGDRAITDRAELVYHADPSLGPNGLWCPSLLTPSKPRTVRLFSFGMAHKIQPQYYRKVRELLDAAGLDYTLRVSVGLHEGTSLSDATQHFDALKEIMGADKVTILGILSDDAVVEELQAADYVLAFFDRGLRANNTTVHAALQYGKRVITNHDRQTCETMALHTIDILNWSVWPTTELWTWDQLIGEMERIYAATTDRQQAHQR